MPIILELTPSEALALYKHLGEVATPVDYRKSDAESPISDTYDKLEKTLKHLLQTATDIPFHVDSTGIDPKQLLKRWEKRQNVLIEGLEKGKKIPAVQKLEPTTQEKPLSPDIGAPFRSDNVLTLPIDDTTDAPYPRGGKKKNRRRR